MFISQLSEREKRWRNVSLTAVELAEIARSAMFGPVSVFASDFLVGIGGFSFLEGPLFIDLFFGVFPRWAGSLGYAVKQRMKVLEIDDANAPKFVARSQHRTADRP
jgi:hypothetical protein